LKVQEGSERVRHQWLPNTLPSPVQRKLSPDFYVLHGPHTPHTGRPPPSASYATDQRSFERYHPRRPPLPQDWVFATTLKTAIENRGKTSAQCVSGRRGPSLERPATRLGHISANLCTHHRIVEDVSVFQDFLTLTAFVTLTL